ncbi:unnamed protein product [marine sediment metagenome]|uniref:Uncharacterized protein n=1 Tax=marine sediment metagenome TaxID=412755 RepID=X0VMI2_9ZZZZ
MTQRTKEKVLKWSGGGKTAWALFKSAFRPLDEPLPLETVAYISQIGKDIERKLAEPDATAANETQEELPR